MPQVLDLPSLYGGGAGLPSVEPSRESLLKRSLDMLKESPIGIGIGPDMRGSIVRRIDPSVPDCCPCGGKKGEQSPSPSNQAPTGLGQPPGPQKPFQNSADPCSPAREALARAGLTPEMLKDCLTPQAISRSAAERGLAPRSTRKAPKKRVRKAKSRFYPGKKPKKASSSARKSASKKLRVKSRAPHKELPSGYWILQNGACYNPRTRKFVKRSNCK